MDPFIDRNSHGALVRYRLAQLSLHAVREEPYNPLVAGSHPSAMISSIEVCVIEGLAEICNRSRFGLPAVVNLVLWRRDCEQIIWTTCTLSIVSRHFVGQGGPFKRSELCRLALALVSAGGN